jgi:hypothetical protein
MALKWQYAVLVALEAEAGAKDVFAWQVRVLRADAQHEAWPTERGKEEDFAAAIARMGEDGWEMVAVTDPTPLPGRQRPTTVQTAWFKRALTGE